MASRQLHTKLLLQNPDLELSTEGSLESAVNLLVEGQYMKVIDLYSNSVFRDEKILEDVKGSDVKAMVGSIADRIESNLVDQSSVLIVAVLFLQIFVQTNFTGPKLPLDGCSIESLGFLGVLSTRAKEDDQFASSLQKGLLSLLSVGGQSAYRITDSPIFLVLSLRLLEKLQSPSISLMDPNSLATEQLVESCLPATNPETLTACSISWWRSRALQVQQSLYPDYSGILTVLSLRLISAAAQPFIDTAAPESAINQSVLLCHHLESSNISLAGNSESQTVSSLADAEKISGMKFVLTGCKAKQTQYQQKATAALTVLAKSQESLLRATAKEAAAINPQDVKLNDDTFLERPVYEDMGDEELLSSQGASRFAPQAANDLKRVKVDYSNYNIQSDSPDVSQKLIPTVLRSEDIPKELSELDPNNQPALSNLDNIQLLLRMQTVQENSPQGDSLINEELIALVQRVLFSPENSVNWLVFSRALWWRSLLETTKAKTVERGLLQLYSLVEELGSTSDQTARIFPKTEDEIEFPGEFLNSELDDSKVLANSVRLRYIYLLPLMPKWGLDSMLAQKLTEFGLHKSALEIYERLDQWTEAAVCYASSDNLVEAEKCIKKSLEEDENDARAWAVYGDIKQDPELWEKSWSLGRYANAKRSLSRYYRRPPRGVEPDMQKAIDHMYDCLCADPISFTNWYTYGCMGLQVGNFALASEAFKRCVTLDDDSPYAWSNLASAYLQLGKLPEAFTALGKAVNAGETSKKSWRIWENYQLVAAKLGKWDEVLTATDLLLDAKRDKGEAGALDIPIMEKLVDILTSKEYDGSFFQRKCIEFMGKVESVINDDPRCWRDVAKVHMWLKKPWLALEDYEKAYRAAVNNPQLTLDESVWNDAVEQCQDLVSAYENLGELPGRHGAGDVVCKDWKFKAKSAVRSLISKGKKAWEYTDSYDKLKELKSELLS